MKTKTGASKVNISMPKELYDYLKKMVAEHNAKPENAYCPTDRSKMVQKAIRTMIDEDRKSKIFGQAMPDPHTPQNNLIKPSSETLDGGLSTATTARYQKAGRRKSST
jgi:hypothetical protein